LYFLFFLGDSFSSSPLSSVANSNLRLFFSLCFSLRSFSFFLFLLSLLSASLSLPELSFRLVLIAFLRILAHFDLVSLSPLVSFVDDESRDFRALFLFFAFVSFCLGFSSSSSASFHSFLTLTIFSVFIFPFSGSGRFDALVGSLLLLSVCGHASIPFKFAS